MKLHDAINKAEFLETMIKRKSKDGYIDCNKSPYLKQFSKVDILADDWILEELALKRCPFCGGSAIFSENDEDSWHVHCGNYKCPLDVVTTDYPNKQEAMKAWNTRVGEK